MAINVNQPPKKESGLDKVLKALTVAKDVFGVYVDYKRLGEITQNNELQLKANERAERADERATAESQRTQAEFDQKQQKLTQEQSELTQKKDPTSEESKRAFEAYRGAGVNPKPGLSAFVYEQQYGPTSKYYTAKAENAFKMQAKAAEEKPDLNIAGFTAAPGQAPTKIDAQKFKDQLIATKNVINTLDRAQIRVTEHGTEYLPTQAKRDMSQDITEIQMQLKEIANLGVLNGPDLELMLKEVPDPTALKEQFNPMAGEQIATAYGNLKEIIRQKLAVQAEVRGFQPVAQSPLLQATKRSQQAGSGDPLLKTAQASEQRDPLVEATAKANNVSYEQAQWLLGKRKK